VNALVNGLINPIIAAIFGKTDLTGVMNFTINGAHFSIGLILDATVSFLCVAAAVYFLIVMPMNKLAERRARGKEPEPDPLTVDQQLLTDIRDSLRTRPY
jgi:large conductance mechanosensitive channel